MLAVLATVFYVAAVIPFCPHVEAWALHLGCILSLAASWWVALRRQGAFTLRGLLFGLVALSVLCAGAQRASSLEASLETDLWWLERERAFGVRPPDAELTIEDLRTIAAERRDGWMRASVDGLARLGARPCADLLDTSPPRVERERYALSVLGEDRIGILKAKRALELDHRRRAEEARRVFLEVSAR